MEIDWVDGRKVFRKIGLNSLKSFRQMKEKSGKNQPRNRSKLITQSVVQLAESQTGRSVWKSIKVTDKVIVFDVV